MRANITAHKINTEWNEALVMALQHGTLLVSPLQSQNWAVLIWAFVFSHGLAGDPWATLLTDVTSFSGNGKGKEFEIIRYLIAI